MKKKLLFFVATLLAGVTSALAQAYDFYAASPNGQILWYKINSDNISVTVVSPGGYFNEDSKPAGNLIVPDTVYHGGNAYAVTGIEGGAFQDCPITALHLPATYTSSFDDGAFLGMTVLSQITVDPANPVYDSRNNCNAIIRTATNCLLKGCESTVLWDGIDTIYGHAFRDSWGLTSVTIPPSVRYIGYRAFTNTHLSNITFQEGPGAMLFIGPEVFHGDQDLTALHIPAHVMGIGGEAFYRCYNINSITVDPANPIYDSRDSCNAIIVSSTNVLKVGCKNTTIPTSVTKIAYSANIGDHNETYANIIIPSWVTEFVPYDGRWNFPYATESIASVTIPMGWTNINNSILRYSNWTLIFLDSVPPTLSHYDDEIPDYWYDPDSYNYSQPIIVPCGSLSRWTNHPVWGAYNNIHEPGVPQLTVDAQHGSAEVVTLPTCGNDTATVSATATEEHYHFVRWSDGSTQNPYTLVLTGNTTLTALFAIDSASVTVASADAGKGSVMGGGVIPLGGSATVTAVPTGDNIFLTWSNGVTANPYTFTVTSDTTLTAQFTLPDTLVLHDTTYVPVHDTTYIDVHDTTYVPVHDTTYVPVHDTTYVPVYAVEYVDRYIHDTAFVNSYVHDTTIQYVNNYVFDTTYINNYVHDTTIQYVNNYVFDTTYINNYVHDTTTLYVNQYVYDTTFINNYIHDTTTLYVNQYVHDTTYINNYLHDTIAMTTQMFDTMIVNLYQFDTSIYNNYNYDTVIVNNYYYDTVFIHYHDNSYVNETGTDGVSAVDVKVYTSRRQIVVEGAEENIVTLYDATGRIMAAKQDYYNPLRFDVPAPGTYMLKVGNYPARRVVVK